MWRLKQFMPGKEGAGVSLEGKHVDVGDLKLQVRSVIAQGGFSCVYLAREASSGKTYALKHIICNDMESVEVVKREVAVMKSLRGHPNVISLQGHVVYDLGRTKECFVVMEYCPKMLAHVLENRGAGYYEEKQILVIFLHICNAVYAMHCQSPPIAHRSLQDLNANTCVLGGRNPFLHRLQTSKEFCKIRFFLPEIADRDLKVENVLMGPDGLWKLCDFGSTSVNHKHFDTPDEMGLEEDFIRKYTTPAYRAPEMWDLYQRQLISEKVDIWALGCLLYRIAYLKSAFDGESKLQVLNCNYKIPDVPKYSNVITGLIKDMLNPSPEARPDVMQVWQRVNDALPSDLRRSHPDKAASSHTPLPTQKNFDTGGFLEGAKALSSKDSDQRPGSASAMNNHSPKGAFWSTPHAQNLKADEPLSRQEKNTNTKDTTPTKVGSQATVSRYLNDSPPKDSTLPSGKNSKEKVQSQGSAPVPRRRNYADEVELLDIKLDSDSSNWKFDEDERPKAPVLLSPIGSLPSRQRYLQDNTGSPGEPFDGNLTQGNVSSQSRTNEQLKAEVDRLNVVLSQVLNDKSAITSRFEEMIAICRAQKQEIQDLKSALASGANNKTSSQQEMFNLQQQQVMSPGQLQPQQNAGAQNSEQAAEQSGTIWDLQEGLSSNNSSAQQGGWQAFANPSRDVEFLGQNHRQRLTINHTDSMPVRAPPPQNSRRSTFGGETWKLAQERGSPSPSPLPLPATSNNFHMPKTLIGGTTSNTNQLSPAGWAGF